MKFLLDVHLGGSLVNLLEQDGHQCRLVSDIDPTLDDSKILDIARQNGEIVLTHDLDFGRLLAFSKKGEPSVVIFRIEKINSLIFNKLIRDNWETIEYPLARGSIVIIEPHAVRIRTLPIDN